MLGGCAADVPACRPQPVAADTVYVIDHGWHTDLGIPAAALTGPLASFRQTFPGMTMLIAGFGRRTFMTAPVHGLEDFLVGPFPGDGALLVAGLTAPPDLAYGSGTLVRLRLPPGGAARLSDFVWSTFRVEHGRPVMLAPGFFAGSRFYETRIGYSGLYTCNSWTEAALHAAGLPLPSPSGVVLAGQVTGPASHLAGGACRIGPGQDRAFGSATRPAAGS